MGPIIESSLFQLSKIRSAAFGVQNRIFNSLRQYLPGLDDLFPESNELTRAVIERELNNLLRRDSRHIARGRYPVTVLKPESLTAPLRFLPELAWKSLSIQIRRLQERPPEASAFHEHEVDILFYGATDAMRRLLLVPMRRALKSKDGAGLRILELGAGNGAATRFVSLAFPKAKIVAVDLNPTSLQTARRNLLGHSRIDFIQGDGSKLPFKQRQFDAVFSVFLLHELDLTARKSIFFEINRVTRPGGFIGAVDSLQLGETPELDNLLLKSPKFFQGPTYGNYLESPLESHLTELGLQQIRKTRGFLAKACWGRKPDNGVLETATAPKLS